MLMFNFDFFRRKKINAITSEILNSKTTYLIILLLMLIQFALVSVIFFQNKKNKYINEQLNSKINQIDFQQKQLTGQFSSIQSTIMRMSSQLYRIQGEDK